MAKGKKLAGWDTAVSELRVEVVKGVKSVCKILVEKVPTIEPQTLAEVVMVLIDNPKILYELTETRASFGMLRFITANVGEKVENCSSVMEESKKF